MRRSGLASLGVAALGLAAASAARAEVTEASEDGFVLALSFDAAASPEAAFAALTDVAAWWSPAHTYSGDAANMSLELSPGGCFCEVWDGGATRHGEVVQIRTGRSFRLLGALGPLQDMGASQIQDLSVEPLETGARVSWTTRVSGRPGDGYAEIAPLVDSVLAEQMGRLERYLATGSPDAE